MTDPTPIDLLLRRATARRRLGPLLGALGFAVRLVPVPRSAFAARGLDADSGVRALVEAGECGGLAAVLVELEGDVTTEAVARTARRLRAHDPVRPVLFIFAGPAYRRLGFASFGLGDELRQLIVDRTDPRRSDLDALEELAARPGESGVALAVRHARALDRTWLTRQFFRDFRALRDRIAMAWTGLPEAAGAERERLALLLLCRLMFLYFLQSRGHLAGDPAYLPELFRRWQRRPGEGTFYRAILDPLFFGALNTRPEHRSPTALALGPLPYLNGGLFERHALERRFPALDLGDDVVAAIFDDLLERYRFTTREAAEAAADRADELGIDPEMLGRVFEELMAADRRSTSGTFFTPAAAVDRLVRAALELLARERFGLCGPEAEALIRRGDVGDLGLERRRELAAGLAGLRILDPACGSGAFLVGALSRLARVRAALGGGAAAEVRREIVGRSLHGVDVQEDAALLCALRLWLALAVEGNDDTGPPPPLPNLDRRIRQGDALVDPIDLVAGGDARGPGWSGGGNVATVRRALRVIEPLAKRYLTAGPEERPALQKALAEAELRLGREWLETIESRVTATLHELRSRAAERDLFGERPASARQAEASAREVQARHREIQRLRAALDEAGALPFFSFEIHFAEAAESGFDLILSNPPWVRAHRWPAAVGRLVRESYAVCRTAGWRRGTELAGAPAGVAAQVDLSLLFLERSVRLLAPGGVLAMLVPAKAVRSLYGSGARRLLLRETRIAALEDHGLDQRSIFQADAFSAAVVAYKPTRVGGGAGKGGEMAWKSAGVDGAGGVEAELVGATAGLVGTDAEATGMGEPMRPGTGPDLVRVTMVRRGREPLRFEVAQSELPIFPDDPEAPWLLAPPATRAALRRMQAAGPPFGTRSELRPRRGIVTGANDVLILREAEPKLGNLARIRAEGYERARRDGKDAAETRRFAALIEDRALRPLVRGCDVEAWRYQSSRQLLWVHDDESGAATEPPPRVSRYLARHTATLRARSGWRPGMQPGAVFRLSTATLQPKVAWHDLAETLKAVALPARIRGIGGREVPLIPLNTVYFIPTDSDDTALLLAALLNSLPVRTFARAVAERAKDARFRFLAWTISLLPVPTDWDRRPAAVAMLEISREAHARGGITHDAQARLDALVATLYGLSGHEMDALAEFDRWLSPPGRTTRKLPGKYHGSEHADRSLPTAAGTVPR